VSVTVAFGTEAPEESRTVPINAPVEEDWLNSAGAKTVEKQSRTTQLNRKMRGPEREKAIIGTWIHPSVDFSS
jgi:hypothetical protein